jgi:predicted phage tail protein
LGTAISAIVRRAVVAFKSDSSAAFFTRPSSKLAELTMKFETIAGNQRSRRSKSNLQAPAIVESLEVRSLMTVLSPTGTVNDATPTIAWEAVDNAISYDLWVADREQVTVQFVKNGITTTHYTPTAPLNLGKARAWVRPNFAGGVQGDWSTPTDFIVEVKPTVTGPVNSQLTATPYKLNETQPTITWNTPPGASRFEIFLSDQTNLTGQTYTVVNLTPVLDEDGFAFFDENHQIVREEKTSFELPDDLQMGSYRVFMRSRDDGGRWSDWSAPLNFEIAPQVTITRPKGPSFQNPPLLEWQAIADATSYDVFVAKSSTPDKALYNVKVQTGTSYQIPKTLADGEYVFWVRAHRKVTGRPDVAGIWSNPTTFSTIQAPVVTGPIGLTNVIAGKQVVTDSRPTIQWTAIDKAARYDVWLHRANTNPTYLVTTATTNSYVLESDIKPGDYTVWIRAISTTGKMTDWSAPYSFTATGGVPVITSPTTGDNVVPIPDITWTPVTGAKSYNIQIAWLGVDFTYIETVGITLTTFAPTDPLPTGSYRVWVQAVNADGTKLPWSAPVNFTVALNEEVLPSGEIPELLAVLLPTTEDAQADVVEESHGSGQI